MFEGFVKSLINMFQELGLKPFAFSMLLEVFLIWQLRRSFTFFLKIYHLKQQKNQNIRLFTGTNLIQLYKTAFFLLLFVLNTFAIFDIMLGGGRFQNEW